MISISISLLMTFFFVPEVDTIQIVHSLMQASLIVVVEKKDVETVEVVVSSLLLDYFSVDEVKVDVEVDVDVDVAVNDSYLIYGQVFSLD
jgi:hypothetical protein